MRLNKFAIPVIVGLFSVPFMAQAKFSVTHELKKTQNSSRHYSKNELDNKCRVRRPNIRCWTRFANKKSNVYAQYMLGTFFYNGVSVNRNRKKAVVYFKKASYKNNGKAQLMLAKMFQKGQGGLRRSNSNALAWYFVTIRKHKNNAIFSNKVKRLRRNLSDRMSRKAIRQAKQLANNLENKVK